MKLVLFNEGRPGILRNDGVVDASQLVKKYTPGVGQEAMVALIERYAELKPDLQKLEKGGKAIPLSEIALYAPLPHPDKILNMGGNYKEFGARQPAPMWGFIKTPESIIGPGGTVVLPPVDANIFHHEAELVVVFGRSAKKVSQADAMDLVFGYTCGVDVSARMPARPGGAPGGGRIPNTMPVSGPKSFPGFAPLGPCIVTKDEIPDPHNVKVRLWVNEELRANYGTDDLAHSIPESIEWANNIEDISPGDVLFMGTNHQGLGAMQDGDLIELEITGIPRLNFHVADPLKRRWKRGVDELTAKDVREGAGGPGQKQRPL